MFLSDLKTFQVWETDRKGQKLLFLNGHHSLSSAVGSYPKTVFQTDVFLQTRRSHSRKDSRFIPFVKISFILLPLHHKWESCAYSCPLGTKSYTLTIWLKEKNIHLYHLSCMAWKLCFSFFGNESMHYVVVFHHICPTEKIILKLGLAKLRRKVLLTVLIF